MRRSKWTIPLLLLAAVAACGDGTTGPDPGPERSAQLVSGAPGSIGVADEVPLTVRVTDDGTPAAEVEVEWEVVGGDGTFEPSSGATDPDGRASALWRVGTRAGTRTLRIRAEGADPLVFEVEARAGSAASVRIISDTVRLTARRERQDAGARFEDVYGNAAEVPGDVAWAVDDPTVAEVDAEGRVRAAGNGSTRVWLDTPVGTDTATVVVGFRGVITVTFDDGLRSTHTRAFPILDELGLRANVAVVTRAVEESWDDYVTLDQLVELDEAGWAVVSHTVTHADLAGLPADSLRAELVESRAWIEAQGFRGAGVFVVPYHSWDDAVRTEVARHYELARGTSAVQFFPDTLVQWMPDEPYALTALEAETTPMATEEGRELIRSFLERAVEEGYFIELFFHDIGEDMLEDFRLTMEIVAEFGEHVVPYDELLEKYIESQPLTADLIARSEITPARSADSGPRTSLRTRFTASGVP